MRVIKAFIAVSLTTLLTGQAFAQANLPLYTDHLVNGFQNWSWGTLNFGNTAPVHSGTTSVSLSGTAWNVALSLYHPGFSTSPYASVTLWANGGSGGGQVLHVYAHVNGADTSGVNLSALPANTWQQYTIPLASLGADNKTNLELITFQLSGSGTANPFYIDDVQLNAKAAPATVHIAINSSQTLRAADSRWFGINTAIWDGNFDTPQTVSLLREMGTTILRFPGGSLSDEYHWGSNKSGTNTWTWATSFANFVHVATNVGVQAFITVDYGSGTPEEAAGWVRHSNVTNHYNFTYWEIGNENYGDWETDTNSNPHDPYTYALRATNYIQQMRSADPTIKIGVVVAAGENSYSNAYTPAHAVTNPRTGRTAYGWTPILLTTLKNADFTPDFVVHHVYPEWTGQESDALLLQSTSSWARDAADLRQQISDYFGASGTNIEIVCTENNSNSGNQGRQSTSLVNGLYYADSLASLMKTELNGFVWWDLRNGADTSGSFDPTLYGWRTVGDLGVIGGLSTRYPPFYAAKLMQYFVRPGEGLLNATSDYLLVSAYAARQSNGSLNVLVLNRDTVGTFNTQINLNGFVPQATATVRSFGILQDEAARTNAPAAAQDIETNTFTSAATSFSYPFPPLSMTLFTFAPAAPNLIVLPPTPQPGGQLLLQLQGQAGVRYLLESSTNLATWSPIATNTLSGTSVTFTNPVPASPGQRFWRAAWKP